MIFGQPYEFAIFYDVLERSEDNYWEYGIFIFLIEDEIFPSKGSNYTLSMALDYLKDSQSEVISCEYNGLDISMDAIALLRILAHSHGMLLDSDPPDLEFPISEKIGVFLSPLEIIDAGFYLFYYSGEKDEEYLIYSSDYGNTARSTVLTKGTVSRVLEAINPKMLFNK